MFKLTSHENPRVIRVFISSTFVDMQDEREQLIKHTFPQLRKLARERGVELTEIDLRWGITQQAAERGETIARCLGEIERSRPYFIGLLGHRYGWIPSQPLPGEAEVDRVERLEKLKRRLRREETLYTAVDLLDESLSATEVEIQHGVLRSVDTRNRSRFYYRVTSPAEFSEPKGSEAEVKLSALKALLGERLKTHPPLEYSSLEQLHLAVLADFQGFLDDEYPASKKPNSLHSAINAHREFAQSRLGIWEGDGGLLDELDEHFESGAGQVLVTAPAGLGKSALLAHWIAHRQDLDDQVFYAFCGGGPGTARWSDLLRFLFRQVADFFGSTGEEAKEPNKDSDLALKFCALLTSAAAQHQGRFLIVVDGLDQVADKGELRWWPFAFPSEVLVVAGVRSGSTADLLAARGMPVVTLEPLKVLDRKKVIRSVLKRSAKDLGDALLAEIAEDKESGNPLVLRTLLQELKAHGDHADLPAFVRSYISTDSEQAFFDKVVERIDRDYPNAQVVLPLFGVAVEGLSESEIREASGLGDQHFLWAELHDVLAPQFVERDGLLSFGHDYLRQAVARRYLLPGDEARYQRQLAEYFLADGRKLDGHALREWPELLARCGARERLKAELPQPEVTEALAQDAPADLRRWWLATGCTADEVEDLITQPLGEAWLPERTTAIPGFIGDWLGRYRWVCGFEERRLDSRLSTLGKDHPDTISAKSNLAASYSALGRHQEALVLKEQVLAERRRILGPDHTATISAQSNLAVTYAALGRQEEALRMREQVLADRLRLLGTDNRLTINARLRLAVSYSALGRQNDALREIEQVSADRLRLLGPYHPDTISAQSNLAVSYSALARSQEALELKEQVLAGRQRLLGPDHPDTIVAKGNLATSYSDLGRHQEALELEEQVLADRLRIFGPDHPDTIVAKGNLKISYSQLGRNQEALELQEQVRADRLRTLGPDHPDTVRAGHGLALTYLNLERPADALPYAQQVVTALSRVQGERSSEIMDEVDTLARCLEALGRNSEALVLRQRIFEVFSEVFGDADEQTQEARQKLDRLESLS